jgi:hypothetical protein
MTVTEWNSRAYVLSEFDKVVGERLEGRLWLVFWEKTRRWLAWIKVDEPDAIIDHLYGIGCRSEFESLFEDVVVDAFQCNRSDTPTGSTSPVSHRRLAPGRHLFCATVASRSLSDTSFAEARPVVLFEVAHFKNRIATWPDLAGIFEPRFKPTGLSVLPAKKQEN